MVDTELKSGETSSITITFSEAVSSFSASDLMVENGIVSGLTTMDNIIYTGTFTPKYKCRRCNQCNNIDNKLYRYYWKHRNTCDKHSFAIDTKAPTANIAFSDSSLKAGESSQVTITFSEKVANFSIADLTVTNGTLKDLKTEDNITYTATFTPNDNIESTANTITLANTYTDVAGNTSTALHPFSHRCVSSSFGEALCALLCKSSTASFESSGVFSGSNP